MARRSRGTTRGTLTLVEAAAEPLAADFVDPWLAALTAEDRSPATLRAYRAAVHGFLAWYAAEEGRSPLLADLSPIALQGWRGALQHGHGDAPARATATVNARLAALRAWCAWLHEAGHLARDPTATGEEGAAS